MPKKKKGPKSVLGKLWGNGKGKFRIGRVQLGDCARTILALSRIAATGR